MCTSTVRSPTASTKQWNDHNNNDVQSIVLVGVGAGREMESPLNETTKNSWCHVDRSRLRIVNEPKMATTAKRIPINVNDSNLNAWGTGCTHIQRPFIKMILLECGVVIENYMGDVRCKDELCVLFKHSARPYTHACVFSQYLRARHERADVWGMDNRMLMIH